MTYENQVIQRTAKAAINESLRRYMLKIYNYMALALTLAGGVAYAIGNSPAALQMIFGSSLGRMFAIFGPFVIAMTLQTRIGRISIPAAQGTFWLYAASIGLSISTIFAMYTNESIARMFFITAGMFAAISAYGYTTKRDMSGWGGALTMGIIGILIAMVVNFFLNSQAFDMMISFVIIIVCSGLVAYHTQNLRDLFYALQNREGDVERVAIIGALQLFISFINIFLSLLRLFGDRR